MRLGRGGTPRDEGSAATGLDDFWDTRPPATGSPTQIDPCEQDWIPLGEVLLRTGAVTHDQVALALADQQTSAKPIGRALIDLGALDEKGLVAALAEQSGVRLVNLGARSPASDAPQVMPEAMARALGAIPLAPDPLHEAAGDPVLDVALSDPAAGAQISRALARPVRVFLATPAEVRQAIDRTYRALADLDHEVAAFTAAHEARPGAHRLDVDAASGDAPVVRVVNMILTQALRDRASDVHLEPQDGYLRVRFRVDGALGDIQRLPADIGPAVSSRVKVMAGMNIVERRRPQDGQITTSIDGRDVDIRVSSAGTLWGEKVVLRILDKTRPYYRLQDLGMPQHTHDGYGHLIRSPYGMVICAGPTGSGKTTTLYASISEVNGPERNITTIEDPVEYVFPGITQIQINEAAGITFATGLRSILRQDPDMILVGEMRDVETARIAVQSALTGHFVLSSLHATDAVSALYRFLDMGIEAFLVASSVLGVVGQRLVRRSCRSCLERYEPTPAEHAFYAEAGGEPTGDFWAGRGCNLCSGTGYSDRVGVYELLTVTEQMRELIVEPHPSHDAMRRLAIVQGMAPLRTTGVRLVEDGVTTIAEIIRSIYTL